ncbi:hypothetical protein [Sphingobacterium sp. MYb388]|uniref:hypothetical protein n=1 Tax=Sphingobacterium sp. MYb388 TaxID=2745437 RepID=UPI0030967891
MKETIVRVNTESNGKQFGIMIDYIPMEDGQLYQLESRKYNIEYFDKNQIKLDDGEYPKSMFDQVVPMASIVLPGDPIPISHYRGLKIKKEFIKYQ